MSLEPEIWRLDRICLDSVASDFSSDPPTFLLYLQACFSKEISIPSFSWIENSHILIVFAECGQRDVDLTWTQRFQNKHVNWLSLQIACTFSDVAPCYKAAAF